MCCKWMLCWIRLDIDYSQCNFVGGDLSSLLVGYSNGIATRWGINDRVQFLHLPAEEFLHQIQKHYAGPVRLIAFQFPTPFRLATKSSDDEGNSQLPTDAESGFMVTPSLLRTARDVVKSSSGYLLLQSNCEDVAVAMKKMALEASFECLDAMLAVMDLPGEEDESLPQRTREYIQAGGERAWGKEWSAVPLLPRYGQTETEVACELQNTPVHRCLLRPLQ